jgi:taurine dioxygenase
LFTALHHRYYRHRRKRELIAHSIKPEFRYRHHWSERDVVMWDNRCVNHRATGGYEYPDIRHLYRTTVEGGPTA